MERHHLRAVLFLSVGVVLAVVAATDFLSMRVRDDIRPSASLTRTMRLSAFHQRLAGTDADTDVYVFDSGSPGATVLVLGGTHPNEMAGFMAAVVLVERARVVTGRLIVIPQACQSGFSSTDPLEGVPSRFTLQTPSGQRSFRSGARGANPLLQWPDPLVYRHSPSGQVLAGAESRNLNRAYPGRPDGSQMEQVGFAIVEMIRREAVDVAFDLHEAAPEIPIINAIVTHEKGREIAGSAVLELEFQDLSYALELSPPNFRGLSHREWGDATTVVPFLMETSNPIQGRLRGRTSETLILRGEDDRYRQAVELGKMRITYDPAGEPLAKRVGRHLQGMQAILTAYQEVHPEKPFVLENIPAHSELVDEGVGAYLN